MDVMERRQKLLCDPLLPPPYKRVLYLESSGTQFIDTNISGGDSNTHPSYEIDFMPLNSDKIYQQYFAGSDRMYGLVKVYREGELRPVTVHNRNGFYPRAMNVYEFGVRYKITSSETNVTINGVAIPGLASTATYGWGEYSWYIFSSHRENDLKSNMRLYGLKMANDGALIRNYIPCIRISDGKPGLYDTVSKTFYDNAGTGEFVVP